MFKRYTTSDGIANNTIYGVLVDDNDNIWVSTNKGISQIDTKNNTVNNLSVTDGLQGMSLMEMQHLKVKVENYSLVG